MFFNVAILLAGLLLAVDTPDLHVKQGLGLRAKGDLAGAKAEFRQALVLDPKLSVAHFHLASVLLAEGHASQALDELQGVPHSAAVDHLLGLAYLETGDAARAATYFIHSNDAEGHYYLGVALGQQGKFGDALREFRKSIALRPGFGPAHESLGVGLRRQGDNAGALREFQLAAKAMPKNAVTFCDLGLSYKENKQYAEAEKALRGALELQPDFERARYALGIVLRMRGKASEAASQMGAVREAHEQRTNAAQVRKLTNDGAAALQSGHAEQARVSLEEAAMLDPADASAQFYLGLTEEKLGDAAQAQRCFERAIALKPDFAAAHMRLGILKARAKESDEALEQLRLAAALDTDSAEAQFNLAKLWEMLGKPGEAQQALQECLTIDPANLEARMLLGNVFAEQNDVEGAVSAYQELLRRKSDWPEAHNNLGLVWLNSGKKDLAAEEFRAALRLRPGYDAAEYNLRLALEH